MGLLKKLSFRQKRMVNKLIARVLERFSKIPDERSPNASTSLPNTLRLSFAMFHLKMPSLLHFRNHYSVRAENLQRIYGVDELPGDVAIRGAIDKVDTAELKKGFSDQVEFLRTHKIWKKRRVLGGRFTAISSDGTQHYCSNNKGCPQCLVRNHRNGKTGYYHQMLGAVAVHPDSKVVLPVGCEAIINEDGGTKNDCELNALKRLIPQIRVTFGAKEPIVQLLDALYHNGPCIQLLEKHKMSYIIGAKGDHYVGVQVASLMEKGEMQEHTWHEKNKRCTVKYAKGLILNGKHQEIQVNYFALTQTDKVTGEQLFYSDWITDIDLDSIDLMELTKVARSRWKIENETFNTLKNQGYHLEHNYGHGKKNLMTNFTVLMFLAFLVDQIAMITDELFKEAKKICSSYKFFWERIRQVFDMAPAMSMEAIYRFIIKKKLLDIPPLI